MSAEAFFHDVASALRLLRISITGADHQQRLDSFYSAQAAEYDRFRQKLLWGRAEMMQLAAKDLPPGAVWYDFGAGTGQNLEFVREPARLQKIALLDLCAPLLAQAEQRVALLGLTNTQILHHDACKSHPLLEPETADLITFSYSLSMIPDWFLAIDHACRLLKPGAVIAVVDFYIARRHAPVKHSTLTRRAWPAWFGMDNVELSQDHLPYLRAQYEQTQCCEARHRLPFLPLLKVPVYYFLGKKRDC